MHLQFHVVPRNKGRLPNVKHLIFKVKNGLFTTALIHTSDKEKQKQMIANYIETAEKNRQKQISRKTSYNKEI